MNGHVDPHPAINATFSINTLDKPTSAADNAIDWQPNIISIRKHTFNPVVNLKGGIAYRAPGFTMPGFDALVQAKWAG
jgi:hypothetical protein